LDHEKKKTLLQDMHQRGAELICNDSTVKQCAVATIHELPIDVLDPGILPREREEGKSVSVLPRHKTDARVFATLEL
jgi:hypothetical protein